MSDERPAPKLFLLGQRLSRLGEQVAPEERQGHVCGGATRAVEEREATNHWERVWRPRLVVRALGTGAWQRVALVCDAGLGKTTNMEWLRACLARPGGRQLPLLLRLDLVHDLEEVLLRDNAHTETLLEHLADEVGGRGAGRQRLLAGLERLRCEGRVTLLIDGLDHAISQGGVAEVLSKLLRSRWGGCPVWISGRPWAFERTWPLVSGPEWTFLRVEPLEAPEVRFYLSETVEPDPDNRAGLPWHSFLPDEGRHLLSVPRFLTLTARILRRAVARARAQGRDARQAVETLALHTRADVYRLAYLEPGEYVAPGDRTSSYDERLDCRGLIAQGLDVSLRLSDKLTQYLGLQPGDVPDGSNHLERVHFVAALLGAIAFEMYADPVRHRDDDQEVSAEDEPVGPNTVGVPGGKMKGFRTAVARRLREAGVWDGASIANEFTLLGMANNQTVDFLLFRELGTSALAWHDRTAQAFFAAYWAVNFATEEEDFRVLERWKGVVDRKGKRLADFDEFWQFAAEMPVVDRRRWQRTFEPCYRPPWEVRGEHEWVQWHRRMLYHSLEPMRQRSPGTVIGWQATYQSLKGGTAEQRRICGEIEEGLRLIDKGVCPYGADPLEDLGDPPQAGEEIAVEGFCLHQWPVTNEMYELFDPAHLAERWDGKHPLAGPDGQGDARCPVVNVTWYDACCFAAWLGEIMWNGRRYCFCLPTELQWEHAVRAGTSSRWFFGNDKGELKKYAHFYQFYQDVGAGSTRPVDEAVEGRPARQPNRHGLYDVYGNVFEWCADRYGPGASARVLRGGSWDGFGRGCWSAYRDRDEPDNRNQNVHRNVGFRLAAVPVVGAKRGEQGGASGA